MSGIFAVHRHMNNGSDAVAFHTIHTELFHQLAVACCNPYAVHLCSHTIAADLFDIRYTALIQGFSVCLFKALADRMGGMAFCQCCVFQQLLCIHGRMMHTAYFEHALRHGSCLIKYNIFGFGKCFQIVGAFYQNTCVARTADSGKEAQGNTDDQCARAANYQKGQCPHNPIAPFRCHSKKQQPYKGRQNCQRQGSVADRRRIVFCKFGNKILGSGLFGACIFYHVQDLRYRRFAKLLCRPDFQHAGHVDAAADDFVSNADFPREALTGQGAGI